METDHESAAAQGLSHGPHHVLALSKPRERERESNRLHSEDSLEPHARAQLQTLHRWPALSEGGIGIQARSARFNIPCQVPELFTLHIVIKDIY